MADEYTPREKRVDPGTTPPSGGEIGVPSQPDGVGSNIRFQQQGPLGTTPETRSDEERMESYNAAIEAAKARVGKSTGIQTTQQVKETNKNIEQTKQQVARDLETKKQALTQLQTYYTNLDKIPHVSDETMHIVRGQISAKQSEIAELEKNRSAVDRLYSQSTKQVVQKVEQERIMSVGQQQKESALEAHKRLGSQVETRNVGGATVLVSAMSPQVEKVTRTPITSRGPSVLTSLTDVKAAENLGYGTLSISQKQPVETVSPKFRSVDMVTPVTLQEQQQKEFLSYAKEAGYKYIYKKTETGYEKIPLSQATIELAKSQDAQYVLLPKIPKDSAVLTTLNTTGPEVIFLSTKQEVEKYPTSGKEKQDFPKSYKSTDITPKNVFEGFYKGGVLPFTEFLLTPRPWIGSILVPKIREAEKEAARTLPGRIGAGPSLDSETLKQLIQQRPLTGTGHGLGYDVGSGIFFGATIAAPTGKVPLPIKVKSFEVLAETKPLITVKSITTSKTKPSQITTAERELTAKGPKVIQTSEKEITVLEKPTTKLTPTITITKPVKEAGTIKISTPEGKVIKTLTPEEAKVIPPEDIEALVKGKTKVDELTPTGKAKILELVPSKIPAGSLAAKLEVTPSTKTAELVARGINIRNVVPELVSGVKGFGQIVARKPKVFYHGTPPTNIEKIVTRGFHNKPAVDWSHGFLVKNAIYAATSKSEASSYGGGVLKLVLKDTAKMLDLTKPFKTKRGIPIDAILENKITELMKKGSTKSFIDTVKTAQKAGYDVVKDPWNPEVVIFNPNKIIKKIKNLTPKSLAVEKVQPVTPETQTIGTRTQEQIARQRLGNLKYKIAQSTSSRGHYIGGTSAVELLVPKGTFRQAKDVDVYVKSSGNPLADVKAVKAEGEKLLKVVQEFDKKMGIERDLGYNFLELAEQKGKSMFFVKDLAKDEMIFEVMIRGTPKNVRHADKITTFGGVRARHASQVIKDKSQIIRVFKKGEDVPQGKLEKAIQDVKLFKETESIRKSYFATIKEAETKPVKTSDEPLVGLGKGKKVKTTIAKSSEGKPLTIWRGLSFRNQPLVGVQQGKLVLGIDYKRIPFQKIAIGSKEFKRSGYEAAFGFGMEKKFFYTPKSLEEQVRRGIIPPIAQERGEAWVKGVDTAEELGVPANVGEYGKLPIKGLTQRQSDYELGFVARQQKQKNVELVHGSAALRPQISETLKAEAGTELKLGDVDIVPTKQTPEEAERLMKLFVKDFPLENGQKLRVEKPEGVGNIQAILEEKGKSSSKIFEVVLKESEQTKAGEDISKGTHILGYEIPFKKSVTAKDIPVKTHVMEFQLLTNVKQALAYQKGGKTFLDIYPSSGRTKDIVRGYWALKETALTRGSEELEKQSEKIRSLYPGVEFTDVKPEKLLLSASVKKPSILPPSDFITPTSLLATKLTVERNESPPSLEKPQSITSKPIISSYSKLSYKPATKSAYHGLATKKIGSSFTQSPATKSQSVWDSFGSKSNIPKSKLNSVTSSISSKPTKSSLINTSKKPSTSISSSSKGSSSKGSTTSTSTLGSSLTSTSSTLNLKTVPIITIPEEKIPKFPAVPFWKTRMYKPFKEKDKPRADFLGNVPTTEIGGVFGKRRDIIYGRKKTEKLVAVDVLESSKGRFTKTRKSSIGKKATYFFTAKPNKGKKASAKSLLRL